MLAEFDVEIGGDAPCLVVPWAAADGSMRFIDLHRNPEMIEQVPEAHFPEVRAALARLNAGESRCFTAKCDVWSTQELDAEEQIRGVTWKRSSYIDVVLQDARQRADFHHCERLMREWVRRLRGRETEGSVSVVLRECVVNHANGYYWTVYVNGYGEAEADASLAWAKAVTETTTVLCGDPL
jgi:hypothetical protein